MPTVSRTEIAEVIAVYPNNIKVRVFDIDAFRRSGAGSDESALRVGSYLLVKGDDGGGILAMIDNFMLEPTETGAGNHLLEASPIGYMASDGKFTRGATRISIPPAGVEPADPAAIQAIFTDVETTARFDFARLATEPDTRVPVDGNRFFNKHFAIVGSTGSGKSHTLAAVLQRAVASRDAGFTGLNNAHIVIFDLHGEYRSAFPDANMVDVTNLELPYWLMNAEELEELLIDSTEQAYNQSALVRQLIRLNKRLKGGDGRWTVDTPSFFDLREVTNALWNLNSEYIVSATPGKVAFEPTDGSTDGDHLYGSEEEKWTDYFMEKYKFVKRTSGVQTKQGPWDKLEKLISRLEAKIDDPRLSFMFPREAPPADLGTVLRKILGAGLNDKANVTVVDLSGVPFEVLSLTVSLLSRLVFDVAYHLKRARIDTRTDDRPQTPFLLVYEEAHKYVPSTADSRFNACRQSIERIAKEGRKYGATLGIVSQRPSEISETIFSQCNNFVAMRLTNPADQAYVERLLPDSLGQLIRTLPTLPQGDALLIGDAVVMPAQVSIERCDPQPSSTDIRYLEEWRREWLDPAFDDVVRRWLAR